MGSKARRTVSERERARRRTAQRAGALGMLLALALPLLLFHRVLAQTAWPARLDVRYLVGYLPWLLIALGIALFVPVVMSIGRNPDSRLYPRARNAYAGWAITLYLLGLGLATQVQELSLGAAAA